MYEILAVLAGFAMVYAIVAGRVERTWISGPIIFMAFGVLLGPVGIGLLATERNPELLKGLAEMTLALVLFTDAAGADLGVLRRASRLPLRLLLIGLPLTIALGVGAGKLLFGDWPLLEIALLATMLAPTDAALGKAVVTNEAVPDTLRQGLNVESGLNDGICVPVLFLFLALIAGSGGDESALQIGLHLLVEEIGIGVGVGVVIATIAAVLLKVCHRLGWLSETWMKVTVAAIAFACFGTAQTLGGSGFIASFVGGMLFGAMTRPHVEELREAAEGIGDTFSLLTWVLFGAAVVGQVVGYITVGAVVYALLSLTVIRMLPVFISLTGLAGTAEDKLFIGWFGPRGLASIVFAVIVSETELEHGGMISVIVVCTVTLSILLHGITANPWAKAIGSRS
jgi:NhaP-type Na+/H+ or K+/H+ antiporter